MQGGADAVMKNTFGNALSVTLFGESHGAAIGTVIDGIAPGIEIDTDYIDKKLALRRPSGKISTARSESDNVIFESGVYNGRTTGTPICLLIKNADTHSSDYSELAGKARPGHADYPAFCKYHGFEDARGGGHFSGRITAALVAAGAIVQSALKKQGIVIGTHISRLATIDDKKMSAEDAVRLENAEFPLVDESLEEPMKAAILRAREDGDSVGGILETTVVGMPSGVGEPWFDTVESMLSHALFSVPAVKGVEFGDGFALADMRGSEANDAYRIGSGGKSVTDTNHNGGIGGGITNGQPIVFRCAVKPTPSISKEQNTVDFLNNQNTQIAIKGRHDPCIVHRARAVVDAVTALTLADMLTVRYGTDWLAR